MWICVRRRGVRSTSSPSQSDIRGFNFRSRNINNFAVFPGAFLIRIERGPILRQTGYRVTVQLPGKLRIATAFSRNLEPGCEPQINVWWRLFYFFFFFFNNSHRKSLLKENFSSYQVFLVSGCYFLLLFCPIFHVFDLFHGFDPILIWMTNKKKEFLLQWQRSISKTQALH